MQSRRRIWRTLRRPFHLRDARARLRRLHEQQPSLEAVVTASLDLGSKGLLKIKAQQVESEIIRLARAVAEIRPRVILEIGTARGGTLLIWAHLASELVVTCDLEQPQYRRELYRGFAPPKGPEIVPLAGDSHDPDFRAQVEKLLAGRSVDFLFIDGDHTRDGVRADYEGYKGLVRPGGLIAFHDIVPRQPVETNQVQHFWAELRPRVEAEELVEDWDQVGFGIGVVRV